MSMCRGRMQRWREGLTYAEENLRRADPLAVARDTPLQLEITLRTAPPHLRDSRARMAALLTALQQHTAHDLY